MRRILKEVAPISQDQILNEVLNPLIRHQNALNNANTMNCMNNSQFSRAGKFLTASPQLTAIDNVHCLNRQSGPNSPSPKRL